MVTAESKYASDRFVDWVYGLTGILCQEVGVSEQLAAKSIKVMVNAVQEEYGGRRVYIHSGDKPNTSTSMLKGKIMELWRKGNGTRTISEQLETTESYVRRVVLSQCHDRGKTNGR